MFHNLPPLVRGKKFVVYNANPKKSYTNDCMIRGISIAYDISWEEVLQKYYQISLEKGLFNDSSISQQIIDERCEKIQCIFKGKKRITAFEFSRSHKEGRYLIIVKSGFGSHCVPCVNGVLYDTWDSSSKICLRAYKVKE